MITWGNPKSNHSIFLKSSEKLTKKPKFAAQNTYIS